MCDAAKNRVKSGLQRKINVCNVDEEGRFGGPARRIVHVAKELKKHNVETQVVFPKCDSERFFKELLLANIKCTSKNITRLTKEKKILFKYIIRFPIELMQLVSFFRKKKFDLIHVNGSYQFKSALAGKLASVPVVWHLNDSKMDSVVKSICIFLAKYCATGLIVTGMRVYEYYVRGTNLVNKPFYAIQVPVDTKVFNPNIVTSDVRLNEIKGKKIVTVSGINPTKGLEYFIEMALKLNQKYSDLTFLIAGAEFNSQKNYYRKLKDIIAGTSLAKDNLIFVGMIDDIPSFLKGADIFVYTSISESGPAAVWEAMAMGKPIVSTDVGSVSEYIKDGVSGYVVPIKDSKALTEKVERLIMDPELCESMGKEAIGIAQEKLDVSAAAKKHALFYDKIITSTIRPN